MMLTSSVRVVGVSSLSAHTPFASSKSVRKPSKVWVQATVGESLRQTSFLKKEVLVQSLGAPAPSMSSLSTKRGSPLRTLATASPVASQDGAAPKMTENPMDIVFISSEVAPWSKTGGLGDVVGSLPVELAKRGHNVFSIAPRFDQYADAWDTSVTIDVDGEEVRFFHTIKQGVHRVWVDHVS